ncbi:MAG: monomethylamine:corrinoid methyltransferase [Candidatus Verstraetearchaeota archaeon]|nr:monomethylamine:corrinoid methyltransferase [Candidatus Verstraetearchaeota archaeon]
MSSYRLDEITRRAFEGPLLEEKEFDMLLMKRTRELVKEYGLRYDPKELVCTDDSLADDVFEAGLMLLLELGFYCQSTKRRIMLEEKEVKGALKALPESIKLGCGRDAVTMHMRRIEDPRPPVIHAGPTGTLCSEGEAYIKILRSYAQEQAIDSIGAGTLSTIDGLKIRKDTPQEFRAARKLAWWARQAADEAGRPGMHINDVAVVSPEAKLCALDPAHGLRPTDGIIVSQMAEMKTSLKHLSLVEHLQSYGIHIGNLMTPILGGYAGGPEGTAIVNVAEHIAGAVCYSASYHYCSLTNVKNLNGTDRPGLWAVSMVGQALARNSEIMSVYDCYCASGPGEEMLLLEAAAGGIVASVSGMNVMGCGSCGGKLVDRSTGLEARMLKEAAVAAAGLSRDEANEILNELLPRYEDKLDIFKAPKGKTFQELYDLTSAKPKKEWQDIYEKVSRELAELGLEL